MKQFKNYCLVVLVAALGFAGCSKDSNSENTTISGQGQFTGTGGVSFNLSGINTTFTKQTTNGVSGFIIGGVIATDKQFIISANNITSTGTYSLVPSAIPNSLILITYTAGTDTYYSSASTATAGSITITTLTATSIEGTYNTKVSNLSGAALTISGTFKGTF
jgi:hypothetical protein